MCVSVCLCLCAECTGICILMMPRDYAGGFRLGCCRRGCSRLPIETDKCQWRFSNAENCRSWIVPCYTSIEGFQYRISKAYIGLYANVSISILIRGIPSFNIPYCFILVKPVVLTQIPRARKDVVLVLLYF